MIMKRLIFLFLCIVSVNAALSQPPLPNNHGAWNDRITIGEPYRQLYRYDIQSGTFIPYGSSAPIQTGTAILMLMIGSYAGIKIYRNNKND